MDLIQVKQKSIDLLKNKLGADGLTAEQIEQMNATILEKETEIANIKKQAEGLDAAKIEEIQNRMIKLENALAEPKKSVKLANYINSDQALQDFALTVRNSRTSSEFVENYKEILVKNDITPKNTFLPPAVVQEIKDAWESNAGEFISLLNHTGLKVWKVALENADKDAETSRAKAWTKRGETKGTKNTEISKAEQALSFQNVELRPQIIYKYITIDRETILEDENGLLINYIAKEAAQRILQEVMRAILVGDGRGNVHTAVRFETVARAVTDSFVTVVDSDFLYPTIEDAADAVDSINSEGKKVLVAGRTLLRKWAKDKYGFGGSVSYKTRQALADILGVDYIFDSQYLNITPAKNQYAAVIIDVDAYKTVGNMKMDTFEDFTLSKNASEFLAEIYAGGGLTEFKSAAVIRCGEAQEDESSITVENLKVTCDMSDVVTELQAIGTDVGRTATAVESIDTKTKDANDANEEPGA